MYEKILETFPPPEFLDIAYTGISISDDFARCIRFAKRNGSLVLETYGEKPIPIGVISSGIINNSLGLIETLKSLKKEFNIKYARVSLPEEKSYIFTTTIPVVGRKEVRSTIEFKIEENIPLLAGETSFDYVITNPVDYKDSLEVVVSALPSKIIDAYADCIQKSGILPISLETKSQAIARAIIPKSKKGTFIIVYFGAEEAGLYVADDGVVHFTSTLVLDGESKNDPAFLSNEIKKLEVYWHGFKEGDSKEERHVDQILVCGEGFSNMTVPYLSARHKVPVSLGNVWSNVLNLDNAIPPIPFMESLKYAPAIGLAIPTEILI